MRELTKTFIQDDTKNSKISDIINKDKLKDKDEENNEIPLDENMNVNFNKVDFDNIIKIKDRNYYKNCLKEKSQKLEQ